ncbi:MAG: zinc-binding alcohol dehydrogenase family protein [Myxococcales bacterium]|nr:zinc-binding alcohol dehydrogenase family protein [Myxococcales bacterium]
MKAVGLERYLPISDPDSLLDIEIDKPEPKERDLVVRIEAIAVNPVDTKVRAPKDKVEETPRILGWDAAGVVEEVGEKVTLFEPGDEVYYAGDITRPGAYAEYQAVDERIVGRKPSTLSFAEAAALPLTTITAYEAFFDRLDLDRDGDNRGETLLIIGGAGGVGSIGIQLAKAAELDVIATASRPETIRWVRELGADHVVNHREPLRPQIEALGLSFVNHIAIFNDTDGHWDAVTDLIRPQGRIVTIVENARPLDMDRLKTKAAGLVWELMFTRSMFETPDMIEQHRLLSYVADEIDAGRLRSTVSETLTPINAENLRRAHALIESGKAKGKVTLSWS